MKLRGSDAGRLILEGTTLRARLIREGLSKNGNRWTRQVLEQIAKLVDGVPINFYDMSAKADASMLAHWEALREKLPPAIRARLPEVLPGATIGVVRRPQVVVEDDGSTSVVGDVEIAATAEGWLPSLVQRMRALGRTLGLSIHVPPDGLSAKPIETGGVEPTAVSRVVGFDVVTYPSAGGGFVPVLESLALMEGQGMKISWKKLLRWLSKEQRASFAGKVPDGDIEVATLLESHKDAVKGLLEALKLKYSDESAPAMLESLATLEPAGDPPGDDAAQAAAAKSAADKKAADDAAAKAATVPAGVSEGVRAELEQMKKDLAAINLGTAKALIEAQVKAAELPQGLRDFARAQLTSLLESGQVVTAEKITTFLADLKKSVGVSQNASGQQSDSVLEGFNPIAIQFGITSAEKATAALEGLLMRVPAVELADKSKITSFRSIKEAYQICTGDYAMRGMEYYASAQGRRLKGALESIDPAKEEILRRYMAMGRSVTEAITTASFPLLLSDRMHKTMLLRYQQQPMLWPLVARAETVTDFKTWRFLKRGEFNDVATVAENAAYVLYADASYPAEEEVTLSVSKRGQLMKLTWEMIVNDDTRSFQTFPDKVARAFARTLNKNVFNRILNNSTIYTTTALGTVGQSNLKASAISLANLKAMRRDMVKQKDIDSQEAGRFTPRRVLCGPQIYDQAYELIQSDRKPILSGTDSNQAAGTARSTTIDNQNVPNILRGDYGLTLHEVLYYDDVDNDAYTMLADPNESEMMVVGFLNGKQDPELFLQDMQNVGSFFDSDVLTWKGRHVYESVVLDFRGFQLAIP